MRMDLIKKEIYRLANDEKRKVRDKQRRRWTDRE